LGVSNKAMLVLAADCKSVPEEASCSIQHTPTNLQYGSQQLGQVGQKCINDKMVRFPQLW